MVEHQFDILLTIDKNLKDQQNIMSYEITVVVLDVLFSKIELMRRLLPRFKKEVATMKKRRVYEIK